MRKSIFVGLAALLAVSAFAQAGTIKPRVDGAIAVFSDDFESYAEGPDAVKTVWNGTGHPFSAFGVWNGAGWNTQSKGLASAGGGGNGPGTPPAWLAADTVLQYNFAAPIAISDSRPIVVEVDAWDYNSATRDTIGIRGASAIYEFGVYNSMDNGANYPNNGTTTGGYGMRAVNVGARTGVTNQSWWAVRSTRSIGAGTINYHHYKAVIRATDVTMTVTLGNGNSYTRTIATTTANLKTLTNVRLGGPSGVTSAGNIYYDNVQVYRTPEPASMLLLGLGGLLLRRRRA